MQRACRFLLGGHPKSILFFPLHSIWLLTEQEQAKKLSLINEKTLILNSNIKLRINEASKTDLLAIQHMCPHNGQKSAERRPDPNPTGNKAAAVASCLLATPNIKFPAAELRSWGGNVTSRIIAHEDYQESFTEALWSRWLPLVAVSCQFKWISPSCCFNGLIISLFRPFKTAEFHFRFELNSPSRAVKSSSPRGCDS